MHDFFFREKRNSWHASWSGRVLKFEREKRKKMPVEMLWQTEKLLGVWSESSKQSSLTYDFDFYFGRACDGDGLELRSSLVEINCLDYLSNFFRKKSIAR